MRGYSIISDEERKAIIKQHESVYDGYAVGNVPSNMYPLTVADYATDKGGITVNNKGEVTTYKNHLVNESEVKEYASADTNYDEVDSAYDFQSGGPEEFEPDYETDPMDSDIQAIQNMFDFQSQNDNDPDAREMVKNSENAMNQEFSGKEKYGDEENAYDFESDGPGDAYESVIKENMCEQCGMTETLCECWMKEEVEKDLQESFKKEKERITEMFNRFKKYN